MSSSTSIPGARIGKYRILAHIATGGMGTVYKALDEEFSRTVALKVLDPDLARNPILVERFKREARAAALLSHRNMVQLFECGYADGLYYLSMEYIKGIDLSEYIRRKGQLDHEEARRILIQACKALSHALEHGITHRDIKPSNFLLANEDGRCRVKLTDLGLSRIDNEDEFRVTRAGTTVGTVDYMAPEQARDSSLADIRSDIYSLGCTFYHMLAGQPPFSEGGLGERVYKHIAADPADVRDANPRVPAGLWTVLRRMLAKHPDDRFQTPDEVIEALRSVAGPDPASTISLGGPLSSSDSSSSLQHDEVNVQPQSGSNSDTLESDIFGAVSKTPAPEAPPPARITPGTHPPKRNRPTTISEAPGTQADPQPDLLGVTAEQRHAASGQFAHATEVMRSGGDLNYAQQLLISCCKLDPGNVLYRKMLREVTRDRKSGTKESWFGSLTILPARGRVKKARNAGDHRKVLEEGEELLTRAPDDIATHIDMAQSAEALRLDGLAVWLLEEARRRDGQSVPLLRELARIYERQKRLNHAITVWEKVRELNPSDSESGDKIRELSVNDTLARGKFRE